MYVIVGLGNPGLRYQETRHNVGFQVIDSIAGDLKIDINKNKFKAQIGEGLINDEKVILVKPQTYMNLSGESVEEIINWYKIPSSNLIIVYDDVDLSVGKVRIRPKGSSGTHNGMRSIISSLDTEDFPRVRIGIGKPEIPEMDLGDFVLSRFFQEEKSEIETGIKNAAEAVKVIVRQGVGFAMNKFNKS